MLAALSNIQKAFKTVNEHRFFFNKYINLTLMSAFSSALSKKPFLFLTMRKAQVSS